VSKDLPHFRLHDLRHFMATEMLAAGVPIATGFPALSELTSQSTLVPRFRTGEDLRKADDCNGTE